MRKTSILILLTCFILSYNTNAQTQAEKKILKELKKEFKAKDVTYFKEKDGFKYIKIWAKDMNLIIADSVGNLIIPSSYKNSADIYYVEYIAPEIRGYVNGSQNFLDEEKFSPGNERCFNLKIRLGESNYRYVFYDISGNEINSFPSLTSFRNDENINAYLAVDDKGKMGLVARDGKILIPIKYDYLSTLSNGICYIGQRVGKTMRYGAICISDEIIDNIPCVFHKVVYSDSEKQYLVQFASFDELKPYNSNENYTYIDEGQRLYESGDYENVRKCYAINGEKSQKAKLYIGASYYQEALQYFNDMRDAIRIIEESDDDNDNIYISDISENYNWFKLKKDNAISTLNGYNYTESEKHLVETMKFELNELSSIGQIIFDGVDSKVNLYKQRCANRNENLRIDAENRMKYDLEQQQIELEKKRQENENMRLRNEREWQWQKMENIRRNEEKQRRLKREKEMENKKKEGENKKKNNQLNYHPNNNDKYNRSPLKRRD